MSYAPPTPQATLTGTVLAPRIEVTFPYGARLPGNTGSAQEWVKNLPDRWFDQPTKAWNIAGTGDRPQRIFAEAGIEWVVDPDSELVGTTDLDDLWRPVLKLSRNWPGTVVVYPRLAGHTRIKAMLGPAAAWDRNKRFFKVRVTDLVRPDGTIDPQLERALQAPTQYLLETSRRMRARLQEAHPAAVELARSACVDKPGDQHLGKRAAELINQLRSDTGLDLPDDFGLALYPYQAGGAWATAGNVNSLNDEPGLGKCVTGRTRVLVGDSYRRIDKLWASFAQRTAPVPDDDGVGEVIELAAGSVPVKSMPEGSNRAVWVSASHLYREKIDAPVKTVTTASGAVITATLPHRFLTKDGWKAEIEVGDQIASTRTGMFDSAGSPSLKGWTTVTRVDITRHKGWVYDLTVPEHHNYLAEGLYCHNTRTSLAAAAIHDADRVLVICPPLVLRNWSREASTAFSPIFARKFGQAPALTGSKRNPDPKWTTIIQASRKVPPFPERGILIVADSLLASRPELAVQVKEWAPEAIITDEVHRLGNWMTARGSAVRWLTEALDCPAFALTGTPMQAKITELANQLAITGSLERDFGSPRQYLERYSKEDNFGGRVSIKKMLPELGQILKSGSIVRRLKKDVLPQLPKKLRAVQYVDISRKHFDDAHKELEQKVSDWFDEFEETHGRLPTEPELEEWTKTNVSLLSPLRVAAGRAKVKPAIEIITNLLEDQNDARSEDGGFASPIIVWAHHQEVLQDLKAAMPEKWPTAIIDGSVSADNRSAIADKYQAGKVAVLFCSIVAAGFGITLTRGNLAYFVESDWTPALISQAEDRQARIGQVNQVTCTTLIAEDTLDLHVRAVLHAKEKDLDVVLPGSDHNVTHVDALWKADGTLEQVEMGTVSAVKNEAAILLAIAEGVRAKRKKPAKK
ncbi:hypothetical protein LG293_16405 (plasmid) [Citricoccus nitrophenolicus]